MKIAYISSHPAPYRDAFLGALVRVGSFQTDVYSLYSGDDGHDFWDLESPPYENKVIANKNGGGPLRILFRLLKLVIKGGYDYICWPGFMPSCLILCMLMQILLGRKYVIVADTVEQRKIGRISSWVKRLLVRKAAFLFVPGKKSLEFFSREFGIDHSKICCGAYSLDGKHLEEKIFLYRKDKGSIRKAYGISEGDKVFLMVANMIKTRNYPTTSKAFLDATKGRSDVKFILVGRGPDLPQMQDLAARESSLIVLPGVSFDEMLKLYAISDVYVHGGTEPASTALVIGAIAHLPLISSPAVGCFADVVIDGVSGYGVNDFMSIDQWEKAFKRALRGMSEWSEMGSQARNLSRALDVENVLNEFSKRFV